MFHNRETHPAAFPALSDAQMEAICARGVCKEYADGEALFEQGEKDFGFFMIEKGHVVVVQRTDNGDRPFAEHFEREFTGDIGHVTGQAAVGAAVADGPVRVLHLDHGALRRLVAEDPELSELLLNTFMARRDILLSSGYEHVRLVGSCWQKETAELKDFLARRQALYRWIDPDEDEDVERLLCGLSVAPGDLPVVITHEHGVLKRPTTDRLAEILGLTTEIANETYDLVVIGAGPAGLAAAVYGASEGLSTLALDSSAPGGQAGTSSRIENYLGFPTGVSGAELTSRAVTQARKFGAALSSPSRVESIGCDGQYKLVRLSNGTEIAARALVIATGARYRRLPAKGLERFEGSGVLYAATRAESAMCENDDVAVVGGGNSAGQGAVFLSRSCRKVSIIIRRDSLDQTMSRYLIDRIETTPNIELITKAEVIEAHGDRALEELTLRSKSEETWAIPCSALFVMIGADPCTELAQGCVALDEKGFIVTGADAAAHPDFKEHWMSDRAPFLLETSRPGTFAVGDVRSGSIKRVASAVGEGSMSVKLAHEHLATL